MRNKVVVVSTIVLAFLLVATMLIAQTPRGARRGQRGMGMGMGCQAIGAKIAKQLNLTADQETRLKQIRQDYLTATASTRQRLRSLMAQMPALWAQNPPDAGAVKSLLDQMDPLRTELRDAGIDYAVRAFAVLTPDQQTKVRNWMKSHRMMGMGMGCGMCLGPGAAFGDGSETGQ